MLQKFHFGRIDQTQDLGAFAVSSQIDDLKISDHFSFTESATLESSMKGFHIFPPGPARTHLTFLGGLPILPLVPLPELQIGRT